MRKIICTLVSLLLLASVFAGCKNRNSGEDNSGVSAGGKETTAENTPQTTGEPEEPATDYEYEEDEESGITITKYIGKDEKIIIPNVINGKPVTKIGQNAFRYNFSVTSLSIPNTVKSIGTRAFEGCAHLVSVDLPNSIQVIEKAAFISCIELVSIKIPDSLKALAPSTFARCTALESIEIPGNIESIGFLAFAYCNALAQVIISDGVTTIGDSAFIQCTSLKQITIPSSIVKLDSSVFFESGLEKVDICEGVEEISTDVFAFTNIKSLVLPDSVKILRSGAFAQCKYLESVTLNDGLIEIEENAFGGDISLKEIIIPKTVKKINEVVFTQCSNLEKVKFDGNAPETYRFFDEETGASWGAYDVHYTIYYHEAATGFTSPEWYGYRTELW